MQKDHPRIQRKHRIVSNVTCRFHKLRGEKTEHITNSLDTATLGVHLLEVKTIRPINLGKILEFIRNIEQVIKFSTGSKDLLDRNTDSPFSIIVM